MEFLDFQHFGFNDIERATVLPPIGGGIDRRFQKRSGNVLIDPNGRNGELLPPVSGVVITTVYTFTSLSGVTIISYSGDQILSKSSDTIISSGTGNVWDLLLSDGSFYPYMNTGYDISGNGNHMVSVVDSDYEYISGGNLHLIEKGAVARNPELNPILDFTDGDWSVLGVGAVINDSDTFTSGTGASGVTKAFQMEIGTVYTVTSKSDYSGLELRNGVVGASPLIGVGDGSFTFTAASQNIYLRSPALSLAITQETFLLELSTPEYIPNNNEGQPILPLVDGDTFISGTSFINNTPWRVRLFTTGDTDPEYTFFDKSNTLIYEAAVQASDNYIIGDTGNFHKDEIMQLWIWNNIKVAFKYKWWVRLLGNQYKDLFFYNTALSDADDIQDATNYTNTPEP